MAASQVQEGGLAASQVGANISALLEAYLTDEPLESLFHGCVKQVLVSERSPRPELLPTLQFLFSAAAQETMPAHVEQYVKFVAIQNNHQRVVRLLELLATLVASGIIKARLVCETILRCVDPSKEATWQEALKVVRRIVGGVDYKGCRDLIRCILDHFERQPRAIPEHKLPALLKGKDLLAYILDRNAALLPAYFAHDEIKRHFPPDKNRSVHWILQEEIDKLESSMRTTADLVSGIVHPYLRPVLGVSNISLSAWKLDPVKHCCALKGLLPYRDSLLKPQEDLLLHVMAQPNCRDAVHSVLGMNRQQLQPSAMVEDALVRLGMVAMEITEGASEEDERVFEVWSHFASQLVFSYFLQLVSITAVLNKLQGKLSHCSHRKGRGWLMWALLHFVTSTVQQKQQGSVQTQGSVQKELVPILNLFALLYADKEPLPVPDTSRPLCVQESSMASVWAVYASKAEADGVELPRPTPHVLSEQLKWIYQQEDNPPRASAIPGDYSVPLLLNIYSNNPEISSQLLNILLQALVGSPPDSTPLPLPLPALNTLAMHAKIRLMEKVKLHLVKVAESAKQPQGMETPPISHALLETYSRLLVWLGTRNFQTQLIPVVFKSQAWGLLHVLLEVICYRVHLQLQFSYRFQLLQQLHTVAGVSIIPNQLFITAESAALRLIQALNSPEFLNQLAKQFSVDPKPLLSTESEELNRVFVLVLAKTLHISNMDTVAWLEPFMKVVLTSAPHFWPDSTLAFFPPALRQLCSTPSLTDSKGILLKKVEDEVKKFRGKTSEGEVVQMFAEAESAAVCLCVMWRLLMDGSSVHLAFIKVAQRSQPKKLAAYMRKMVDYIIFTLPPDPTSQLNITILRLRDLVWKYKLFPVERLVLYMVLHGYEGRDAQNCLLLLQCLLVSSQELRQQTSSLVKEVPADYWSQPEWNQKHAAYLSQFPESFQPEVPGIGSPSKPPAMPMYFGNLSLRFLPVLDLVLQRLLEVPDMAAQSLETLLELYGPLYKFHDHPIALLFSTLHYYEWTLAEHPGWKKKLVATIAGANQAVHPLTWYFTAEFCEYLSSPKGESWKPQRSYYLTLVDRLVKGLQPLNSSVPTCDWRFSEFSGPLLCSLHCCLLELLALPLPGRVVAQELVEALYSKADSCQEEHLLLSWVNALGLVFSSLPESFRSALTEEILQILGNPQLIASSLPSLPGSSRPGCLLSLMHAYWHHTNVGTLASLPHWLQTVVHPMLKHEEGLLYVCHLVGPLLQRLHTEKPRVLIDIVKQVYLLLQSVDKQLEGHMQHSDIICDFLYHIKYMHIGDLAREDIDKVVSTLHMPLHVRLRFLVPTSTDLPSNPAPSQQPHRPLPAQPSSEPMQT